MVSLKVSKYFINEGVIVLNERKIRGPRFRAYKCFSFHMDLMEFGYRYLFRKMTILIPKSIVKPSSIAQLHRFINRELPLKGRTRGDVGVI